MSKIICQKWEESESGWGSRPDGYSLHVDDAARQRFVKDAIERQHKYFLSIGMKEGQVPHTYTREDGTPYEAEVTQAIYDEVAASGDGKRYTGSAPYGGIDGWLPYDAPKRPWAPWRAQRWSK